MAAGWGMTSDSTHIYTTDGSSKIFKIDPETWKVQFEIEVHTERNGSIKYQDKLNDFQYDKEENVFWINIWGSTNILKVDMDGKILKKYKFKQLDDKVKQFNTILGNSWSAWESANNVLNGIAIKYEDDCKHLFLTGKNWPFIFEVVPN